MKNIIELAASGKTGWAGGARTIAFVYSNKGNFIVKGFYREVNEYLNSLKSQGYKYFINLSLWNSGKHRDIWEFWKEGVYISNPEFRRGKWTKWKVAAFPRNGKVLEFKRLPKKWIPEFEIF